MDLEGKRLLLSGATGGLGRAIAEELAASGAGLVLSSRKKEQLQELAGSLPGGERRHSLIVADLARRTVSERAARVAFVLAAVCPFLANYAAAVLTETLEIFFTALALDCAAAALNRMHSAGIEPGALDQTCRKLWASTGRPCAHRALNGRQSMA